MFKKVALTLICFAVFLVISSAVLSSDEVGLDGSTLESRVIALEEEVERLSVLLSVVTTSHCQHLAYIEALYRVDVTTNEECVGFIIEVANDLSLD